ncbi:unnamed protein product, partial [Musa textilis]
ATSFQSLETKRSRRKGVRQFRRAAVRFPFHQNQDTSLPISTHKGRRQGRRLLAEAERPPTWFFHHDSMHCSSPLRGSSSSRIECHVHSVDCSSFETSLSLGFWPNNVQFA